MSMIQISSPQGEDFVILCAEDILSGEQIVELATERCKEEGLLSLSDNILRFVRECRDRSERRVIVSQSRTSWMILVPGTSQVLILGSSTSSYVPSLFDEPG